MVYLSNQDHLPDLLIKLETTSFDEFKVGSTGLKIWYGIHETPFGDCLIATTSHGICNLYFLDATVKETVEDMLQAEWGNAEIIYDKQVTQEIYHRIFQPVNVNNYPLVLDVKGTNAIGKNPVSYLIPCHRVIRSSGELGGYRWGLERKQLILEWEASQGRGVNPDFDLK